MHVGLNLVYLVPGETGGMEIYARELVPALQAADAGLELTAFVNREAAAAGLELGAGVRTIVVPVHACRPSSSSTSASTTSGTARTIRRTARRPRPSKPASRK